MTVTAGIDLLAGARAAIREIAEHDAKRDELCRRRDECIANAAANGLTAGQISRGLDRAVSETHVRGVLSRT